MQVLQQQDFKALVDNHPRAIILASRDSEITYVNRKFRDITGYQPDEVIGRKPSVLSSGLHTTAFYRAMWSDLMKNGRWEGLIWNRRKSGEIYPQWLSIYPLEFNESGCFAGVFLDVGDVTAGEDGLASMAYYDPLTELPNRSLFQEFLKARVAQRDHHRSCFGVLFIDLDFFKSINDLHGHQCGDRVLQQAAQCIQSVLRRDDVVARLSGDEFAAIAELNSVNELDGICQRMTQIFRSPVLVDGREYFLSASVGAALHPFHGRTGSALLENADKAMHMAKQAGRACYRLYKAEETEGGRRADQVSEALIASIKTAPEEFRVVYQPQYDLTTGEVAGMEALLRWQHPEFGTVSPAEFVSIAEQRGQIHELTEHLVRCVLADLSMAPEGLPDQLRLAINISARQITDARLEALLEPLFRCIAELGWVPEIEITETHLMHLSGACLERLRQFGERGVMVAVDDFGTGYSSLAYLHTLPIKVLKIDRQFTKRLCGENKDSRIVSAILGIADALELEVVAEGIENPTQYHQLRGLRCHRGQGYLMARPAPWEQIIGKLFDRYQ